MRNFDFIKPKAIWFTVSLIIIAAGLITFFVKGPSFGIDFKGGTLFHIVLETEDFKVSDIRSVLKEFGYGDAVVQEVETEKANFIIRTPSLSKQEEREIIDKMDNQLGVKEVKSIKSVSPTWGNQITRSAIISLLVALVIILAYVSIRLEFKMAITGIVALIHDVLVTLSVYIIVGRDITPATVAAVLTLLGYSLYDTIVIFHRIKENSKNIGKRTFAKMANSSIHQVFMRWVNTLITTLMPIVAILFFGGLTLKDFAFALFIGVLSGGYSSLFIASPLYVMWKEREPYYSTLKKKYSEAA